MVITHHICNSKFKEYKPILQLIPDPKPDTGNDAVEFPWFCGNLFTGNCVGGAQESCEVTAVLTDGNSGFEIGHSYTTVASCEKVDDDAPVPVAGGKNVSNFQEINCAKVPDIDNPGGNPAGVVPAGFIIQ
jgi:hypothetical protein